jgi:hypothetical protein
VPFDQLCVKDLNAVLDEATVEGIRWDETSRQVQVRLCVPVLCDDGLTDVDPRCDLTFLQVSSLRILLRRNRLGTIHYGPVIPLVDQQMLREFFATLTFTDSMDPGRAFDDDSPLDDWPAADSLTVRFSARPVAHSFYWFAECGREEPGGMVGYRLEGLVGFGSLSVAREDGTPIGVSEFAAAGARWWATRISDDPRVTFGRGLERLWPPIRG